MQRQIERKTFMEWLDFWRDKPIIKVITGIRRCGKTTLLELYRQKLLSEGVDERQIVSVNFEDPDLGEFAAFRDAWTFIRAKMDDTLPRTYVFLDEVQRVPDFEKLVDGLFVKKNVDVYITGSNAKFLFGELATFLTGRYVEIAMQTLSFAEYRPLFPELETGRAFNDFMRFGGFPFAASLVGEPHAHSDYLDAILNTILYKDVVARVGLRDTTLLDRLVRFLFDSIGSPLSVNRIVGTFKAEGINIQNRTVDAHVDALCESFLFHKVKRYNVKGKAILKTNCKYYAADTGLRRVAVGDRAGDWGHILENVVFLELRRRHKDVFMGAVGEREVDFVVFENAQPRYFQVALTVRDPATLERELRPLQAIPDQYPKTLLTLDPDPPMDCNGICQLCVTDFLLGK